MKKIINVEGLKTTRDQSKIEEELKMTRLDFEISLEHECVIIEGSADEVRVATIAIQAAGYTVK